MKSKLFSLIIVFGALFSTGSAVSVTPYTPNQEINSVVDHSKIGNKISPTSMSQEENTQKDSPKPTKKKRHLAAKIITGIGVAFGLVVAIFVLSYTAAQH